MEKHFTPKYKYAFYTDKSGRKAVVAISTYAGRTYRGKAFCSTEDVYDEEKGKQIARTRCALKIETKRLSYLQEMYDEHLHLALLESGEVLDIRSRIEESENAIKELCDSLPKDE